MIGGPLLLIANLGVLFDWWDATGAIGLLVVPEFIWEAFLGIYCGRLGVPTGSPRSSRRRSAQRRCSSPNQRGPSTREGKHEEPLTKKRGFRRTSSDKMSRPAGNPVAQLISRRDEMGANPRHAAKPAEGFTTGSQQRPWPAHNEPPRGKCGGGADR